MPGTGTGSVVRPSGAAATPNSYGVLSTSPSRVSAIMCDPSYCGHFERWVDGKPLIDPAWDLNATFSHTEAEVAYGTGNRRWLAAGTNMTSALVTYAAGGGIVTTTAGADNDQAYIMPNNAAEVLGTFGEMTWDLDTQPYYYARIVTGASVAAVSFFFGFKTDLDVGVDDADCLGFSFVAGTDTSWALSCRKNSADVFASNTYSTAQTRVQNTGIVVEASREYELECWVDSNGFPTWRIDNYMWSLANGQLNEILSAPTTAPTRGGGTLLPVGFVHANAAAAKAVTYRNIGVFRKYE